MTAVTLTKTNLAVVGDLKFFVLETDANAATGHTIDLNSDVADGRGALLKTILVTVLIDDAGADKTTTWDPATGIITLGSVTTGIHNLLVIGR